MTDEKLVKTIKGFIVPEPYDMRLKEINAVYEAGGGDISRCIMYAFNHGFLKGRRAERAEAKKKYMKELERHAPGYGLLLTIIERNMSNERFIGFMTARAKNLEKLCSGEDAK